MQTNTITIIVTYNGMDWIRKCLQSLLGSEKPTDILIVDNASTDGTPTLVKNEFPQVNLLESEKNLGFGAANNQGLQMALDDGYEYFFLLNQDAWVETNTISALCESLGNHSEFGIISPIHLNGGSSALDKNFEWYVREEMVPGFLTDYQKERTDQVVYEVPFVNAAAWMLSRSCLMNVGKFHPVFYHYGEDDNYVHRVRAAGFKVGVRTDVTICHDRDQREKVHIPTDFKKLLYKDLALYLLDPAIEVSWSRYKRHVVRRVKLYQDKTQLAKWKAQVKGLVLALSVYFKSRKHYQLSFLVK